MSQPKSLSPPSARQQQGLPSDLESRIAQLDARLRQARAENEAVRSRVSPSPAGLAATPNNSTTNTNNSNTISGAVATPSGSSREPVTTVQSPATGTRTRSPPNVATTGNSKPAPLSSPSRQRFVQAPGASSSITANRFDTASPARPGAAPANTPGPTLYSPWRAAQDSNALVTEREMAVSGQRHNSMKNNMNTQITELKGDLQSTNRAIVEQDMALVDQSRRREVAVAEGNRAVENAEARVQELERVRTLNNQTLNELNSQKNGLQRQIDETKLGIASADARANELEKEQLQMDGRLKEISAALRERERAIVDETEQANMVRRRLESRLQALEEEHHESSERLRKLEANQAAQEAKWRAEEDALQTQNDHSATLLAEMKARQRLLEEEIADREADALRQRELRKVKNEELIAARMRERERDMAASREEIAAQEVELEKERQEVLNELREQLAGIKKQTENKRRAKDAQDGLLAELELKMAHLKSELDQKAILLERCQAAEERVAGLERKHDEQSAELRTITEDVRKKENEVAELEQVAQRLAIKAEDERRLRNHVAELAREVTDTQASIEAERALAEQRERERQNEMERLELDLTSINNEIARIKESGALEIDTLARRNQQLRADLAEKEAALSKAVNEHAAKQAAIAEFEEEKRRMDREQLARKAAAAQAAKAALTELNY